MLRAGALGADAWVGPQRFRIVVPKLSRAHADALVAAASPDLIDRACASRRLGLYFEALAMLWLSAQSDWVVKASNQPVRDAKQTVGAFDLLVQRADGGHLWHVELAFKQYLMRGPARAASSWVGTLARDRLDVKAHYMVRRQLQLSDHPAGQAWLMNHGLEPNPGRAALMLGWLYRPIELFLRGDRALPAATPRGAAVGWWAHASDNPLVRIQNVEWRQVPPVYAVSPLDGEAAARLPLLSTDVLSRTLRRPILVAAMRDQKEQHRGWVLPASEAVNNDS